MTDHEAAGAAITDFNQAIARHSDALKRLEAYGRLVARAGATETPARSWKISTDPDLLRLGGLVCGDRGEPILPDRWPSFDQIALPSRIGTRAPPTATTRGNVSRRSAWIRRAGSNLIGGGNRR